MNPPDGSNSQWDSGRYHWTAPIAFLRRERRRLCDELDVARQVRHGMADAMRVTVTLSGHWGRRGLAWVRLAELRYQRARERAETCRRAIYAATADI